MSELPLNWTKRYVDHEPNAVYFFIYRNKWSFLTCNFYGQWVNGNWLAVTDICTFCSLGYWNKEQGD